MNWTQIEQEAHSLFLASYELEHKPPRPQKVTIPVIHLVVIFVGFLLSLLQGFRTFDVFFKIGLLSAASNEIVVSLLGTSFATIFGIAEGLVAFLAIELLLAVLPFLSGVQTKTPDIRQKLIFPAVVGFIITILAGFIQASSVSPSLKTASSFSTNVLVLILSIGVTAMTYTTWHLAGQIIAMHQKRKEDAEVAFKNALQEYAKTRSQAWAKTKHIWMQRAQARWDGGKTTRRSQSLYKLTADTVEKALEAFTESQGRVPSAVELLAFITDNNYINVPEEDRAAFVRQNKGWVHNLIQRKAAHA